MDKTAPTAASVAQHAERQQAINQPDPFPEEGTDEKILKPGNQDTELSQETRLKATKDALDRDSPTSSNHVPHREPFDL